MTSIQLLRPRRKRGFLALTPLVDVIFLLLIFFMMSSQIAPYSLIVLGTVEVEGASAPATGVLQAPAPAVSPLVLRVSDGRVAMAGGQIGIDELAAAARELVRQGIETFLIIPGRDATVQDIVSVLEALKAAEAASVTVVKPASGARARS